MTGPEFEILSEEDDARLSLGKIVPVYPQAAGLTQRSLRRIVRQALDTCVPAMADCLPYDIRSRSNLLNVARSLINIHYPVQVNIN
jgi:ATP-dependent DNA helicase RecG